MKRIQSSLKPWQIPVANTAPRGPLSAWTHSTEDVLQSAKEQREELGGRHHVWSREELVRCAGALLLMVQLMDESEREVE